MQGKTQEPAGEVQAGDILALAKLKATQTGHTLTTKADKILLPEIHFPVPSISFAIEPKARGDEGKISNALQRIMEEDPTIKMLRDPQTKELVISGNGQLHVELVVNKLKRKYGVEAVSKPRQVPYKETIRKGVEDVRGRHKKQSGGHGQFGDVVLDIKPLPRGSGFQFEEKITGGVVPRQFIPSVEIGVQDFLHKGPLGGFPVVDVSVTLTDGSYHSVDSSDMAFRQAGRIGMQEGMPKCSTVLLEPVMEVEIAVPSEATARINGMIPQRRGQILGFDARDGWPGWDVVRAQIPESEMSDLIVELRSATAGVGTYTAKFHHLAELTGRLADNVLAAHKAAAE
jgi:elongation factor G